MKLYRVNLGLGCPNIGFNTFKYNPGVDYIHFFPMAECAQVYQSYFNYHNVDASVMQCDVDVPSVGGEMGFGLYSTNFVANRDRLFTTPRFHQRVPFIEARVPAGRFDDDMITEIAPSVKPEWRDAKIYEKYRNLAVRYIPQLKFTHDVEARQMTSMELVGDFPFHEYCK